MYCYIVRLLRVVRSPYRSEFTFCLHVFNCGNNVPVAVRCIYMYLWSTQTPSKGDVTDEMSEASNLIKLNLLLDVFLAHTGPFRSSCSLSSIVSRVEICMHV